MIIGFTTGDIQEGVLKDIWSNYNYEARLLYQKDGEFVDSSISNTDTFPTGYSICCFAFSYKNDSSFPFILKWGDKWLYVALEGDSLVSLIDIPKLKDCLSKLTYDGAKQVLAHLISVRSKKWIIIDCGQITHSQDFIQEKGCSFSNRNFEPRVYTTNTSPVSYTNNRVPYRSEAVKEETVTIEGLVLKAPKPGFKTYMLGFLGCGVDVYVDEVLETSPWKGKIRPLDFIKTLRCYNNLSIIAGLRISDFKDNIISLGVLRVEDCDPTSGVKELTFTK